MSPFADHDPGSFGVGFAASLRAHRLAGGLTQEELATRAGLGVRTVRELERGRVARPQRGTVALLADALGLEGTVRDAFVAAVSRRAGPPSARAADRADALFPGRVSTVPSSRPATPVRAAGADSSPLDPPLDSATGSPLALSVSGDAGGAGGAGRPSVRPAPDGGGDDSAAGHPAARSDARPPDGEAGRERMVPPLPSRPELVGRADDLVELREMLLTADLVTLIGLAGVGKTCLALAVAHEHAADAAAVSVAITDVSSCDDVLAAVAAGFGVALPDEVGDRHRRALLVIDGADRSAAATVEAIRWLRVRAPAVKILVTSRHPLDVGAADAVDWRVEPLHTPPVGTPDDIAALREYPAVALFLNRLRQVRREPVRAAEAKALAELVRRLDGLPLAIELAAARGRVLEVPELLLRYGNRVLDLGVGAPDGQRLRDAVAASYRLLDDIERSALRRLCVFRARWSLELAEALLADRPQLDVESVLDRLVGLGLVSVRGPGELRFRLLDVVADFAAERCAVTGELSPARGRHAEVITRVAGRISAELTGSTFTSAVRRLDHLNSDIRAALRHASVHDPHTALRLAAAIPRWCRFRGRDREAWALLRRLLDDPRTADAEPLLRARAQLGAALLACAHGEGVTELSATEAALSTFLAHGDIGGELAARALLCGLWQAVGGSEEVRRHGEAMLKQAMRTGNVREVAVAQNNLTWLDIRAGDLATAARRLVAAAERATEAGDPQVRALAQAKLAEVARLDGREEEAIALGLRAVASITEVGDPGQRVRALGTVGLAFATAGRVDEAAEVLAELSGASGAAGVRAMIDGYLALTRVDRSAAATAFRAAANLLAGRHDARDVLEALVGLAASTGPSPQRDDVLTEISGVCERGGLTLLRRENELLGR